MLSCDLAIWAAIDSKINNTIYFVISFDFSERSASSSWSDGRHKIGLRSEVALRTGRVRLDIAYMINIFPNLLPSGILSVTSHFAPCILIWQTQWTPSVATVDVRSVDNLSLETCPDAELDGIYDTKKSTSRDFLLWSVTWDCCLTWLVFQEANCHIL